MNPTQDLARDLLRLGVRPADRIAVACSGGADSVALLVLLSRIRDALHVVHVDHGLRAGSDEDASFVVQLAGSLGLPASVRPVEVAAGGSVEAVARDARYAALEEEADAAGCRWIATGHTLDDQAETVLLRAIRGTGPDGLAGIAPVRGRIIRPLLGLRRDELRRWLRSEGIAWREDPTNTDAAFERNWLRNEVMPLIEARRPDAAAALARLADAARSDRVLLSRLASDAVEGFVHADAAGVRLDARVAASPKALAARVILSGLRDAGSAGDARSVDRVLALFAGPTGAVDVLPGEVRAVRLPASVGLFPPDRRLPEPAELEQGTQQLAGWGLRVRVGEAASEPWGWRCPVPDGRLVLRGREPGDRVPTCGGARKVQDVLVDRKVPRDLRGLVPVLCADDVPIAVVGATTPPVGWVARGAADRPGTRIVDVEPPSGGWWEEIGLWTRTPHAIRPSPSTTGGR